MRNLLPSDYNTGRSSEKLQCFRKLVLNFEMCGEFLKKMWLVTSFTKLPTLNRQYYEDLFYESQPQATKETGRDNSNPLACHVIKIGQFPLIVRRKTVPDVARQVSTESPVGEPNYLHYLCIMQRIYVYTEYI